MSDHGDAGRWDSTEPTGQEPSDPDGVETVESYEVDGGVVLYDAQNPLAWVEASTAVRLREQA